MTAHLLADRLRGRTQPLGYVSFLSALVHHGALVDAPATVQVASPDLAGREPWPGPVEFVPIPRDLFFGWELGPFEGEIVPVATVEKALVDWLLLAEEQGLEPRLDEIEWDAVDLQALERLLRSEGLDLRALAGLPQRLRASAHDQERARADGLDRLLRSLE